MNTFTLRITINYEDTSESEQMHENALAEYAGKLVEAYLNNPAPSSWVFVISREKSNDPI